MDSFTGRHNARAVFNMLVAAALARIMLPDVQTALHPILFVLQTVPSGHSWQVELELLPVALLKGTKRALAAYSRPRGLRIASSWARRARAVGTIRACRTSLARTGF
jgi:hypothetical protein